MVEPEYIPPDLKSNVALYRFYGMWPPLMKSYFYPLLTTIVLLIVGIRFPITQLVNIFLVDSVDEIINQCLIASVTVAGTVKGVNVYLQQSKLRKLFQLHREMLVIWAKGTDVQFETIAKNNVRILDLFIWMYIAGGIGIVLQAIFSTPGERIYESACLLPRQFGENLVVYYLVIGFQLSCVFFYCVANAIEDTYPVILNLMLCGHFDTLQKQLVNIGVEKVAPTIGYHCRLNQKYYIQLGNCIYYYQSCLR